MLTYQLSTNEHIRHIDRWFAFAESCCNMCQVIPSTFFLRMACGENSQSRRKAFANSYIWTGVLMCAVYVGLTYYFDHIDFILVYPAVQFLFICYFYCACLNEYAKEEDIVYQPHEQQPVVMYQGGGYSSP